MKVAFCLYGLAGGVNDKFGGLPVDFKTGFEHYRKHILGKNDCDVFIHTWSVQFEKQIREIYRPKKALFEKQIVFHEPNFLQKLTNNEPKRINNIYSRWYSTKKSIELKRQYEEERGFKYDCVFITRFDVAFFADLIFSKYNMGNFYAACAGNYYTPEGEKIMNRDYHKIKNTMDTSKLEFRPSGYPYVKGGGIPDYWFFSGSEEMDRFSSLYGNLGKYLGETKKSHSAFGRLNMRIYSNHVLAVRHLRETGMLDKLKFTLKRFDDFELVRRQFLDVQK